VAEGSVGAGTGATIGKLFGMNRAMKSGLGTASIRVGDTGIIVGAIAAINAAGDVYDPNTARIIGGARGTDGKSFVDSAARIRSGYRLKAHEGANTSIGIVATNATLNKTQATKIAQMAHDGLARTIRPVHTNYDGDTIFATATCSVPDSADHGMLGAIAADVMAEAVIRAVKSATSLPGLPAYRDL
jgi:L-aminopeptidase/D-esterase-like protein